MFEESKTKSFTKMSIFYNAGYVSHYKRPVVFVTNNAKVRSECSERVVGYFRFGIRDNRKESRFAGIRKANKSNVSEQFKLKNLPAFQSGFTWLSKFRSLMSRRLEMVITLPASATFEEYSGFSVFSNFKMYFFGFCVFGDSSREGLLYKCLYL